MDQPARTTVPTQAPALLLVEDDSQIVRAMLPGLIFSGHEVVVAGTGDEARSHLCQRAWDAVILDLGLPDVDGMDLIGEIHGDRKIPVIIVSARDSRENRPTALDKGAAHYFEKPFAVPELIAAIAAVLRSETRLED
jgi:two-component system KDP operon response regulator KdpE